VCDVRLGRRAHNLLASEVCRGAHELEWGLPTLLLVLYSSVQYYKYCHPDKIGAAAATTTVDPAQTHVRLSKCPTRIPTHGDSGLAMLLGQGP